ncbi:Zn-dependent metalloprotease [Streptomyces sp. LBL]|uniref:M4 family metallopeptidase n=1 Tax=Streptomyces sp. LBL TaxID=2940562 RepID=UPI00247467D6|nr:M4 family metallopeptidase [Streptomyces sp. LBL]MDH6622715.1 Zn-dependent metalloprotease [Streptomyces sp. LBL]
MIPGQQTATPALVEGIREQAPAARDAAGAARAYLGTKQARYRIADPGRDLEPVKTVSADGQETVRLRQKYHGIPVLGGQYVVRMEKQNGDRVVTGTSGKYFTGLRTGTTAEVDDALAVERAVDAVLSGLRAQDFTAYTQDTQDTQETQDRPPLTGTSHGLVVLPKGPGVLTRHVTVQGEDPAHGEPVLREVYIDARAGYPVLQYSGIRTFGTPAAGGRNAAQRSLAAEAAPAEAGSGVKLDGRSVELPVTHDETRGAYVLRDRSRIHNDTDNALATWDARGMWASDVVGTWPADIQEFASPTPAFGADATEAGAVDAHWAAGQVYDYYRNKHGRDSLDGRGMAINSLVGVTDYGQPYVNAFWDGQKMVYGNGDDEYRPLSAGLDVVGHEMTHGVIEHSADLVYAGQSGAMNEAIADYFGNAIETDAYGIPANDPDAALLGQALCRTKSARECAIRDMNDGRTTAKSFTGVGFGTDNGGVHLNSTIFSGALWDIREDLDPALADRIVYKALTEYLTPIDGFTEGRAAVIAAAKALNVGGRDLTSVQRAFNAHGIVPNWELALGVDSDLLLERVNTTDSQVGAGGGWWAASTSDEKGAEAYSVWAGRTDGTGQLKLMSPNDGRYHVNPATDGRTVVWQAHGSDGVDILARPVAGGPVKVLWHGRSVGNALDVDGDVVAFAYNNQGGRAGVAYLSLKDPANKVQLGGGTYRRATFPSVSDGKVVYQDRRRVRAEQDRQGVRAEQDRQGVRAEYESTTRMIDVATGEETVIQQAAPGADLGPTALTGDHVYWLLDEINQNGVTTLRRAGLDGSGVTDLSPESGPDALNVSTVTASEEAVTMTARTPDTEIRNESLSKLWQFSPTGTGDAVRRSRVSCNRGEQLSAAAAPGTQVLWLDATTGISNLVTRTRPTGSCA